MSCYAALSRYPSSPKTRRRTSPPPSCTKTRNSGTPTTAATSTRCPNSGLMSKFYHDKGGPTIGLGPLGRDLQEEPLCGNPNFRLGARHRDHPCLPSRTGAYDGAVLSGEHYFYINDSGKPEFRDGQAYFFHVWLLNTVPGRWRASSATTTMPRLTKNTRKEETLLPAVLEQYAKIRTQNRSPHLRSRKQHAHHDRRRTTRSSTPNPSSLLHHRPRPHLRVRQRRKKVTKSWSASTEPSSKKRKPNSRERRHQDELSADTLVDSLRRLGGLQP